MSQLAVKWENHKLRSDEENSFILKTFAFNFVISYINLFYYAFFLRDFKQLSLQFVTIIVSKNALFLLKMNLMPYVIYHLKKKSFLKLWIDKRIKIKKLL